MAGHDIGVDDKFVYKISCLPVSNSNASFEQFHAVHLACAISLYIPPSSSGRAARAMLAGYGTYLISLNKLLLLFSSTSALAGCSWPE